MAARSCRGKRVARAARLVDLSAMPIEVSKAKWRDVILVCRKCQKKLDGGFGPDGDRTLKKALKKYLRPGKAPGRKADVAILEAGCFDICPRKAVVAVRASEPKRLLIVPTGADLFEVKARLGLDDGRRLKPPIQNSN